MTFIIPTSKAEHLVEGAEKGKKEVEVVLPEKNREGKRYFPDGEVYVRISRAGKLKGKRVMVLHSGAPEPNEGLVELELILQILKDNRVRPEVFFSYFPYGMQDKVFEKGETNAAENLIKKLINYYQVKKVYIIDPHFGKEKWVKKYPVKSISALPLLIKKAQKDFGPKILFLSPDRGGKRRTGIPGIEKQRINSFQIRTFSSKINLAGKTVAVVDDIIETGGTLLTFYEIAKKAGAKLIIVLATHGVLPSGIAKVKKKYTKLYLTNTIKQKKADVDIIDLILPPW